MMFLVNTPIITSSETSYDSNMVCMSGHVKMASMLKLVMMESHTTADEVINERNAAQVLQKQLFDAHEPNLLDEDDMHIFGSKPMTDPLDLVCCSTCKKPVKASQYAVHADKCGSHKANTTDCMVEDHSGSTKPLKKGRKIKLTINGNQKVHIKVKARSQSECKERAKGSSELDNERVGVVQPIHSKPDQNVPAPLATKIYHSQGNCRLRLELGQLYRESCVEHLGTYTSPNPLQENGFVVSQYSPCSNPTVLPGARTNLVPQRKNVVGGQIPANQSESYLGIPQQLTASRPNCSKQAKAEKIDTQACTLKNDVSRTRGHRAAATNSKNKGSKKAQQQQQTNGQ